jgi:hypothetical protein
MNATINQLTNDHTVEVEATPVHIPPYRMGYALLRAQSLLGFVALVIRCGIAVMLLPALLSPAQTGRWYALIPLVYFCFSLLAVRIPQTNASVRTVLDGLFVFFFVNLTGGIDRDAVVLLAAVIALAMIEDGVRGSVIAACLGLMGVLLSAVIALPLVPPALPMALLTVFVTGVACSWLGAMTERLVQYVCTGVQSHHQPAQPAKDHHHPHAWAGDIEQLLKISNPQQLLRAAKHYARSVATVPVDIQVGTMRMGSVGTDATRIVCEAGGQRVVLTVHCTPARIPATVSGTLRVIGHIVARQWNVPVHIVEAVDVTPTQPMLTSVSTWETLDIPSAGDAPVICEETAAPTMPLQQAVLTVELPEPGELHPKRRQRAHVAQSQLDLWI